MDIWIIQQHKLLTTLWETTTQPYFTLVDGEYQPIHDEQGKPYELATMAQAEAKTREVLTPYLNEIAKEYSA